MTATIETPTLFTPLKLGTVELQHRIVLAPLTRLRADDAHVHTALGVEYYTQRSSTPGTLLITEGTIIAPQAGGFPNVPGIWNDAQIAAWKKVAEAVHTNSSAIFMQIAAIGRVARRTVLEKEGPYDVVGPSAIPIDESSAVPRPLSVEEIKEYARMFAQAAINAVHGAGFDGVEIHSANGYLLDEFLQTNANARTDEYGGSVENRIRFTSEVVDAVQAAVGPERTAIRLSPWSTPQGMRMPDPIPTFAALVKHLATAHPRLAYLHIVEPRADGGLKDVDYSVKETNDFVADIWAPRPLIRAGGFTRELALDVAERKENTLIAVGRYLTNAPYERATFYSAGARGYTDWSFHVEEKL